VADNPPSSSNPYVGLASFQEPDHAHFFGRDTLIQQLSKKLYVLYKNHTIRVLPIIGSAGIGKSSLIQAGLLPYLQKNPWQDIEKFHILRFTPQSQPLQSLANIFNQLDNKVETRHLASQCLTQKTALLDFIKKTTVNNSEPLIIFIDQFEEIYTQCQDKQARQAFINNLLIAASEENAYALVIFNLCSDFLAETEKHVTLSQRIAEQAVIVPMINKKSLQDIIHKPIAENETIFPQTCINLLLEQAQQCDDALPLLQYTLFHLWEAHQQGKNVLTTLSNIGGVSHALTYYAQSIYTTLSEQEQQSARRLFLQLVTLDDKQRYILHTVDIDALISGDKFTSHIHEIIAKFEKIGFIQTSNNKEGHRFIKLMHVSIVQHWIDLQNWIITHHLRFDYYWDAIQLWETSHLYTHRYTYPLLHKKSLTTTHPPKKSTFEIKWVAYLLLPLLLVTSLFFGIQFFNSDNTQVIQAHTDEILQRESLALTALAKNEIKQSNITNGVLLLLEALPNNHEPRPLVKETQETLKTALMQLREKTVLLGHDNSVIKAIFSPGGKYVVTASWDNTARIWDAHTGQLLTILDSHTNALTNLIFSPDGQSLITTSKDKTARIWHLKAGDQIILQGHTDEVTHAAFSPNNEFAATASLDNTVRIWNVKTGEDLFVLQGHTGHVNHVAFSPDGQYLVSSAWDNTAKIWHVKTGQLMTTLQGHEYAIWLAQFSPDGRYVLTASWDKTARIWDIETGKTLTILKGHNKSVTHAEFSPSGNTILTASWDKTARLWDTKTGQLLTTLQGHDSKVYRARFSPDEQFIITVSDDKTARLWHVKTGKLIAILRGHEGEIFYADFSQDSRYLVTTSSDNTARIWHIQPPKIEINDSHALINYANEVVPRRFTAKQRQQFLLSEKR